MRRSPITRLLPWLLAATLVGVASGCATTTKIVYTPEEARAEIDERVDPEGAAIAEVPYEISPRLAQRAREIVARTRAGRTRVFHLADVLAGLRYDVSRTQNADLTFEVGAGDCLSLTNLFVGMSRSVGLDTYFVEARGIEDVSAEDDLYVRHRHIMAGYGQPPQLTIVDFNEVRAGYADYRILSDLEALALYHNTKGYHALREGELELARRYFQIAIDLDDSLAWAHSNLGVVKRRAGRLEEAERLFRAAIARDPGYAPAFRNLAGLLRLKGREAEAAAAEERAERLVRRDPFRHFGIGRSALLAGNYSEAVDALRRAVALEPRFVEAWLELARAASALGDEESARLAIRRVLALDGDNEDALDIERTLNMGQSSAAHGVAKR